MALALIRAARMYQEAVWIAESAPEQAWLLMTSAVETAAHQWRTAQMSPRDSLRTRPDLEALLKSYGDEAFVSQVADIVAPFLGANQKFITFLLTFLPSEPATRPYPYAQHRWSKTALRKSLALIYSYRSMALHGGTPFPAPLCRPQEMQVRIMRMKRDPVDLR
jgi:hypothetical protein